MSGKEKDTKRRDNGTTLQSGYGKTSPLALSVLKMLRRKGEINDSLRKTLVGLLKRS